MSKKMIYLMSFVLVLAVTGTATADQWVITVPDAGFDDHELSWGGYVYIGEAGYTGAWKSHVVGVEGAWVGYGYWDSVGYPEELPALSGNNIMYPRETYPDYIYQILDETFIEGKVYTLSVWVGQPWSGARSWGLYFTGEDYENNLIEASGSAPGSWQQVSLVYTATAADAGKKIGIKMRGDRDVSFEDVTLSYGAALIVSIERRNSFNTYPQIAAPLDEGALIFVDRTHRYRMIPPSLVGADYVMVANDDKAEPFYELDVTLSQPTILYLLLDNRMGHGSMLGESGYLLDPDLHAAGMGWVSFMGFADTGEDIAIDEGGGGTIERWSSIYALPVGAGTVTLFQQYDVTHQQSRNMYGVAAVPATAPGGTIYVDADAGGANNGSSWTDAYRYLQNGLAAAWGGDEIRVAQGIYKPDEDSAHPNGTGYRTATFRLKNGVAVKGGYAGFGEADPDARDIEVYETVVSGDLFGNDGPNFANNGENSYHVVTGSGTNATAVLDGFTITAGNANGSWPNSDGGGMANYNSSPTLTNCTFSGNSTDRSGGGMYNDNSSPTVTNCTFSGNSAMWGGGMYHRGNSNSTITNCTFSGNSADYSGGGMWNLESSPMVTNCTFSDNSAANYGGGMHNWRSRPTLTNCTFSGNSANKQGGGMRNREGSRAILTNCILWGNTAPSGPQIYNYETGSATVRYSDVQGGWPGIGNISANPLFVDPAIGDYHLLPGSPCIDAGDNSAVPPSVVTDLDGNPRIIDGIVDMGAYEGPYRDFLLSAESVIVPEGGTATFTVAPVADPLGMLEVTVAVESGDPDITVESGGLLTFDSFNYTQPQTVTLAAAEDADQVHGSTVILVSAPGVYPAGVTAYELDSEGPTVLYVDCDALGANDGSSWENAFTDLREGLSFAAGTFWVKEIRVAQGAYSPEGPLPDIRQASNPNPADGATYVSRTADLSWTAGSDATSHDVYFGTTSPGMFQGNQTATTFDTGTMAYSTTYYWRIDEVNPLGTITGTVWSFTTIMSPPPPPSPPPMGSSSGQEVDIMADDREATFQLINGVAIYGGYAGAGAPDPNERDIEAYKTILSGDIGMPGDISDNSYHVVTGSGTDATAVLDGFTITAGNANHFWNEYDLGIHYGGGMVNIYGSPTVANCTFSSNQSHHGGGMSNYGSSPSLTNCTFSGNLADHVGGVDGYGGGIFNSTDSSPMVVNCSFTGNSARLRGGGMRNRIRSSPTLTNCTFSENSAGEDGGGIHNNNSSPTLTNCTFNGNSAGFCGGGMFSYSEISPLLTNCTFINNSSRYGGGIYNGTFDWDNSKLTLINCTFKENWAAENGGAIDNSANTFSTIVNCIFTGNVAGQLGGGISSWINSRQTLTNCTFSGNSAGNNGGGMYNNQSSPTVTNCILWGDTPDEIYLYEGISTPVITYSDVQGGWQGQGNMNANPLFLDSAIGDYHLLPDSPCIDAGTNTPPGGLPTTDMDGNPRVIGGRIDMGAYEFNHIPVADAGPDQTVEAQAPWGATVTLDGSGSSDADSIPPLNNDINDFDWYKVDPCDPNADILLGSGEIINCNLAFGEHIIILEVIDRAGAFDTDEVTIFVQDTTPPVFTTIPQDLILECDGSYNVAELNAWLAGATAVDKCGSVTITNDFVGILNECGATGSATVTWTAEDESGNTATTPPVTFTIVDTTPPVIICPADVTLECPADTSVAANGSATAGDTCSSVEITHNDVWQPSCGSAGTLTRTWTATDDCGNGSSCAQTISVVDTTPPEFEFSVTPAVLWPPSHKMVLITPSWTVSDKCDATPEVSLVNISVNEADDAKGAGNTSDDIQVGDDGSIYLRAERSGTGNDRIYTITYRAVDDCGNAAVRSATVTVPHDQR